MENSKILINAKKHVIHLFKTKLPTQVIYHNYNHTLDVVAAANEIAQGENLRDSELELVLLAAWFHDTGFIAGCKGHEDTSKIEAEAFLKKHDFDKEKTKTILGCIEATKMPQNPNNKLEEILCDADLAHLGSKDFIKKSSLLKTEWEVRDCKKIKDSEWLATGISFLENHKYFTDTAFEKFHQQKTKNWLFVKEELKKEKAKEITKKEKSALKASEKKDKIAKADKPEKGVETMFKVTLRNHIKLSDIADTKANILLSVNAIILSIALANLVPKLDKESNHFLIIPTLVFVLTSVASIIGAIISTKPKVTSGKFSRKDIEDKKVNLLFFGNFHKMPLEDFNYGIQKLMNDREYLYGSMTKDLYFLGLVLARKYRLLRITYVVFMIGIIASVLCFVLAFLTIPEEIVTHKLK
ncbi:Pycsar system effector family protein [Flavicella sediminum]|uniref:Pycsar system effector family protein n=1 Tax=Flavicella sediminum TaxID=2585141 RepID=UPI00111E38A4|nr:Pycsar system effector family protein [Flavicella sediminum]